MVLTDGEIFMDPLDLTTVISSPKMQGVERFAIGVRAGSRGRSPGSWKGLLGAVYQTLFRSPSPTPFLPASCPGYHTTPTEARFPSVGIAHWLSGDGESRGNSGSRIRAGWGLVLEETVVS